MTIFGVFNDKNLVEVFKQKKDAQNFLTNTLNKEYEIYIMEIDIRSKWTLKNF